MTLSTESSAAENGCLGAGACRRMWQPEPAVSYAAFAVSHVLEFISRKPPFSVKAQRTPNSSLERPARHQI